MTQICSLLLVSDRESQCQKHTIFHHSRGKIISVKEYKNNIFVYYANDKYADQEYRSEIYCFNTFDDQYMHYENRELKYLGTIIRPNELEYHYFTNNTH